MSIANEIERIQGAKEDIKTSIENKGVNVPPSALLDTYSSYVDQIETGGGGDVEGVDVKSTGVPSGKVLTADGNGGATWKSVDEGFKPIPSEPVYYIKNKEAMIEIE